MSMHEIEDHIEGHTGRIPFRYARFRKWSMIYSLLRLEEYGDCGFTNLRTLKEMMDCQYTFVSTRRDV
ncbi:MAG: hypothetical protein ACLSTO_07880 [Bilophila wadsworthia]